MASQADPSPQEPRPDRYRFTAAQRLHTRRQFAAVFQARCRKQVGPLVFHGRPNAMPQARLGLSVSRRVGKAVVRSRVKRMLREAFRLTQHQWSRGFDLVVVVRPHAPATLEQYRQWMEQARRHVEQTWDKRLRREFGEESG